MFSIGMLGAGLAIQVLTFYNSRYAPRKVRFQRRASLCITFHGSIKLVIHFNQLMRFPQGKCRPTAARPGSQFTFTLSKQRPFEPAKCRPPKGRARLTYDVYSGPYTSRVHIRRGGNPIQDRTFPVFQQPCNKEILGGDPYSIPGFFWNLEAATPAAKPQKSATTLKYGTFPNSPRPVHVSIGRAGLTIRHRTTFNTYCVSGKCRPPMAIALQGRAHYALEDACNTAALAIALARLGTVLRVRESFACE